MAADWPTPAFLDESEPRCDGPTDHAAARLPDRNAEPNAAPRICRRRRDCRRSRDGSMDDVLRRLDALEKSAKPARNRKEDGATSRRRKGTEKNATDEWIDMSARKVERQARRPRADGLHQLGRSRSAGAGVQLFRIPPAAADGRRHGLRRVRLPPADRHRAGKRRRHRPAGRRRQRRLLHDERVAVRRSTVGGSAISSCRSAWSR